MIDLRVFILVCTCIIRWEEQERSSIVHCEAKR